MPTATTAAAAGASLIGWRLAACCLNSKPKPCLGAGAVEHQGRQQPVAAPPVASQGRLRRLVDPGSATLTWSSVWHHLRAVACFGARRRHSTHVCAGVARCVHALLWGGCTENNAARSSVVSQQWRGSRAVVCGVLCCVRSGGRRVARARQLSQSQLARVSTSCRRAPPAPMFRECKGHRSHYTAVQGSRPPQKPD